MSPPLILETKIPLGQVSGRIDHLGIDMKRQRLLVAELGNNSLALIDLAAGRVLHRIAGLSEPQGVAYVPFADSVFVANAGDGSVRALRGEDLAPIGRLELGDDADNVRVDAARSRVLVGYGKGALAVIDPVSLSKTADIPLKVHPEGFQIDETGTQVFVNVPDTHEIVVVDLATGSTQSLPTQEGRLNFPMAIDSEAHRILVVFRRPPRLVALSSQDGYVVAKVETCGDADDVFVDHKRHRVCVSCGEGVIDVLEPVEASYRRLARIPTVSGARTLLFVPELDRLFVAVRAGSNEPAANAGGIKRAGGDLGFPGFMRGVGGVAVLAAAITLWCGEAEAYRPFDGTDAAVADTGDVEIELGPVEYLREGAKHMLFAPDLRVNYGFASNWEASLEGDVSHGLTAGIPGTSVIAGEALLKGVLREGSLQEKTGPSVATEFGVLLPGINDEHGTGAILTGIVSHRWDWGTTHFDAQVELTREQHVDYFLDTIIEGPHDWPVRPVAETFYESDVSLFRTGSVLVGAIWQVQDNIAVDFGLRGARANGQTAGEIRAGVTFAFGVTTKGPDILSRLSASVLHGPH